MWNYAFPIDSSPFASDPLICSQTLLTDDLHTAWGSTSHVPGPVWRALPARFPWIFTHSCEAGFRSSTQLGCKRDYASSRLVLPFPGCLLGWDTLLLELKLKVKSEGNSVSLSLLISSLHFYQWVVLMNRNHGSNLQMSQYWEKQLNRK